jgi:signal peptidase I
MYLKRVIGMPGETVAFVNGQVLINGQALDEPYEKLPCGWNLPPEKLGPDEYFVVGDNRSMPSENHTFGKVERNRIVGKAIP